MVGILESSGGNKRFSGRIIRTRSLKRITRKNFQKFNFFENRINLTSPDSSRGREILNDICRYLLQLNSTDGIILNLLCNSHRAGAAVAKEP